MEVGAYGLLAGFGNFFFFLMKKAGSEVNCIGARPLLKSSWQLEAKKLTALQEVGGTDTYS